MKTWIIVVRGSGVFPLDMLRNDCCWPANGESVQGLVDEGEREVRLRSIRRPTAARWESFGWTVVDAY